MKRKNKSLAIKEYPFVLSFDSEDGVYIAKAVDLKGCHSDGKTPQEAMQNLYEAMEGWIETAQKHHIPVPLPSSSRTQVKKFLLRLNPDNAFKLETLALARNESVNALINDVIAGL